MGKLSFFNLNGYIERYGVDVLVETGSGTGTGIDFARTFNFKSIISIEIVAEQVKKLNETFAHDPRVQVIQGKSNQVLSWVLPQLSKFNILFWLDAHYPGADLGLNGYEDEKNQEINLPLESELDTILQLRKEYKNDVIICDDWRIYEHGPFDGKNMDEIGYGHVAKYENNVINKVKNKFRVCKLYDDEGYLVLEPREQK